METVENLGEPAGLREGEPFGFIRVDVLIECLLVLRLPMLLWVVIASLFVTFAIGVTALGGLAGIRFLAQVWLLAAAMEFLWAVAALLVLLLLWRTHAGPRQRMPGRSAWSMVGSASLAVIGVPCALILGIIVLPTSYPSGCSSLQCDPVSATLLLVWLFGYAALCSLSYCLTTASVIFHVLHLQKQVRVINSDPI